MKNFEIKNNASLTPCGRERVYQNNLVNQSEGYLNIYSAPITTAFSRKGRGIQSGRSMIEMLGVLAIIGVLSVGGIAGYSKAMMKYRINKTIEQITLIAGNVRTFFASQGNYAGLSSSSDTGKAIIKKAKLVPDEMWEDGKDSLQNVWGDDFFITTYSANAFTFQIYGIPQEACIEILSQDWSDLKVNHICHYGPPKCVKTPLDFDTILLLCNKSDESGNLITLGFDTKTVTDADIDASMIE
ncbi:MAG: hypothetical protein IKO06_01730 [Alphaproteobacteria bacterium]|nr:hypothetical protein [Alphaproteobacteria bacterium]